MKKNNGFTMVELLVVIVILGVLAIIAAQTIGDKSEDAKVGELISQITEVQEAMIKCGTLQRNGYTNCDMDELVRLEYLKADVYGDGTGVNAFGGNLIAAGVGGNQNRYTIEATGIPTDGYGAQLVAAFETASVVAPNYDAGTFTGTFGTR